MSQCRVSFEFFPPKNARMEATLWRSVFTLAQVQPQFVSVTYGADPMTRARTHAVIERVHQLTTLPAAPHLTCVGETPDSVRHTLRRYWAQGIRKLVAVRGDQHDGLKIHPELTYASDLVRLARDVADFDITVAAYPETHPEAPSSAFDIDNLKRKLNSGAKRAITQFFFENDAFLRFRDRCVRAGIQSEIIPGILPITRLDKLRAFASRCGASVPLIVEQTFEGLNDDPETFRLLAANYAIEQVRDLKREGVEAFHFYTLNRFDMTYAICHALGIRPVKRQRVSA